MHPSITIRRLKTTTLAICLVQSLAVVSAFAPLRADAHSITASISPRNTKSSLFKSNNAVRGAGNNNFNPFQQQQQLQHNAYNMQLQLAPASLLTTLPPLMTTIGGGLAQGTQEYHFDALAQQHQLQQQLQQHDSNQALADDGTGLPGSMASAAPGAGARGPEEHDDQAISSLTVNNHSPIKELAVPRPPQYLDASVLKPGRDRNSSLAIAAASQALNANPQFASSSNGSANFSSAANGVGASLAGSNLTAKSRSGLPECATQQVCNAIFVRMNYTQRLCECSGNYNWRCSHNLDPQDGHTIELTRKYDRRIYTQIKTCEPLREVRACKAPTDWTLLALQSERSGKAHYVVVCKCPTWAQLEGPYTHNHPPYANIPGIRVYGMLCAHQTARSSAQTYSAYNPSLSVYPDFPWSEALSVVNNTNLAANLDHH